MPSFPWPKRGSGPQSQPQQQQQQQQRPQHQQQPSYQHDRDPTLPNLVLSNEDSNLIYDDDRRDSSSSYTRDPQRQASTFDGMLNSTAARWYRTPSQMGGKTGHAPEPTVGGEEYHEQTQTSPKSTSSKAAPRKSLKTRLAGAFVSRDNLADYAYADDTGEKPSRKKSVLRKGGPPSAYRQPDSSPDRLNVGAGPGGNNIYTAIVDKEPQLPRIPTGSFSEGGFDYNNADGEDHRSNQQQAESDRLGPDAWVQSTTTTPNRLSQQQQQMHSGPAPRQQNPYPPASVPISHEQAQQFTSLTGNRPASRLALSDERPSSPGRLAQAAYSTQLASSPSRQRKDPLGSPMGMRQPGQVQGVRPASTVSLLAGAIQPQSSPSLERGPPQNSPAATPPIRTQLTRGSISNVSTPATPADDPRELEPLKQKYMNVKRQYFAQKKQLEVLQETIAQQNLSESRTALDDGEYIKRLESLDGSVREFAFSIRKHWKSLPSWLEPYVSEDAIQTASKEMIAVGRAFVSRWLYDEIFYKHFHPALPLDLSLGLKQCQRTLGPQQQQRTSSSTTPSETHSAALTRATTWRLATIDGLHPSLSPTSATAITNTTTFVITHAESLRLALSSHLNDPLPADLRLEISISSIIDAAAKILGHIPMESREVHLEYYLPKHPLSPELMKVEAGLPPISAEAGARKRAASRAVSVRGAGVNGSKEEVFADASGTTSDREEEEGDVNADKHDRKASEQGSLRQGLSDAAASAMSTKQKLDAMGDALDDDNNEQDETNGSQEKRVRMAVFMSMQVRGKTGTGSRVLVQAPVFLL